MLLSITTWWHHLDAFEKILWGIALVFSSFYLLQSVLSLSGGDTDHGDGHGDTSGAHEDGGSHYQFFTLKNVISFFVMFGWVGIAAHSSGIGKTGTVLLALAGGAGIVVLMAIILGSMSRLRHSDTLEIDNALNLTCSTYLFIPARRSGIGKVLIKVQGSLRELPAMTDDEKEIATGALVRVKKIINERILLVTNRSMDHILIVAAGAVLFLFIMVMSMFRRYKRCPSDRVLVVYGKVGRSKDGTDGNLSAKCIHGGAAFIWPVIQDYKFLDLTPISIEVNLTNALSKQNIRVDVPSRFRVGSF